MMRKTDTHEKTYFRCDDRIFQVNDSWWFGSREEDHGPFRSRNDAHDALAQFVLDIRGKIELNEVSILDKGDSDSTAWDTRPDVIR
jgi:hypothetical protein